MTEAINSIQTYRGPALQKANYESAYLEEKLQKAKDEQGFLGNIWNGVKEFTNLGQSASDCDYMLDKYNAGKISFEEAVAYIEEFENKQENMTNLFSNILTGTGSIAATVMALGTGPVGWAAAIAAGAPAGAILKTAIKTADRATNGIEGDALDANEMLKDALSGALTGATSAVSSGVGAGIKAGKIGISVANGTKCGVVCGAASGAGNYLIDSALDEEKEFDFGEMLKNTATSAFVSGTVGAAVGGGMYGIASAAGNTGKEVAKTTMQTIAQDSTSSAARKLLGQAERSALA